MAFDLFYIYTFVITALVTLVFCLALHFNTETYPILHRYEDEKYFYIPSKNKTEAFPSLDDDWSIHISIIIPAYNEQDRLMPMLKECMAYLENRRKSGLTYEVIVVSDGSTDNTFEIAIAYASRYNTIRVLDLVRNRGKGGAVRLGMQSARGSVLLFVDADGATKFSDLEKLDESLKSVLGFDYRTDPEKTSESHAIICGSRAHLEKEETAKRSYFRLFLMHGFHFLVWILCVKGVHDTQCGFKLLTRRSARIVFQALHVERWAFDVEMLFIAQKLNIPITEVAVTWTEIEGSKVVPFWSWLQMGRDLFLIWARYTLGIWKIRNVENH